MPQPKIIDAFICYRRGDREEVADWLFANLHQRTIEGHAGEGQAGTTYRVHVYQDHRVPATDWTREHAYALEKADVLFVVCSRMLVADFREQDGVDHVRAELSRWVAKTKKGKKTGAKAPILIETQRKERDRIVPRRFARDWENVQGIVIDDVDRLEADPSEKRRMLEQLDATLVERFEDYRDEKDRLIDSLKSWRRSLLASLVGLAVVAGLALWFGASSVRAAERATRSQHVSEARALMAEGRRLSADEPLLGLALALDALDGIAELGSAAAPLRDELRRSCGCWPRVGVSRGSRRPVSCTSPPASSSTSTSPRTGR